MTDLEKLLSELEKDSVFINNVTRWERISAGDGEYRDFPQELHPSLSSSLNERGIDRLYSHQEEAFRSVRAGKDTVIVTPTASGKTLCYNLPVIQTLLEKPEARALYIFPTKALSQDQQAELNGLVAEGDLTVKVSTYDGDTPSSLRVSARESGRIVITNPDMLHSGVLPNHPKWIKFLKALEYIVIDEIHIYRGIFGSHMTNLMRRLLRITRFYGADPKFICCSATIGNPAELAGKIIGRDVKLIDKSGAPRGEKHMILYNPPLVDAVQGIRRGITKEAKSIAVKFLSRGIKTIVFARSRVRTELIAGYINSSLSNFFNQNSRIRVEAYRGGFLPNERRSIEKGLRDGEIHGVISTNALELGIDIGGLDVSILSGIPASIASSWQQSGRAGRKKTLSVSFLIASVSPTDQYLITHPEYFFGKSPEKGFVDPNNLYILMDHLKCAAFELPFGDEESLSGEDEIELLNYLESEGVIRHTGEKWYWSDRGYPAEEVSLRSATSENVVIINTTKGKNEVIGEMDKPSAKELIFDEAVYLHRGVQYQVEKLDLENLKCYVQESALNFYTDSIVKTDIKVLSEDEIFSGCGIDQLLGDVLVRSQISKYKKLKFNTNENVGYGEIFLPEEEMHTRALLLKFHQETPAGQAFDLMDDEEQMVVAARMGTLMKNVAPIFLLCDSRDIGVAERIRDPHTELPTLYIYDNHPGGTGLSEAFSEKLESILSACRELVENCPCESGCPSCVGAHEDSVSSDAKAAVLKVLIPWTDHIEGNSGKT